MIKHNVFFNINIRNYIYITVELLKIYKKIIDFYIYIWYNVDIKKYQLEF